MWLAILMALIAGMLAGLVTGLFHTAFGIPAILAGILTQFALWSVNLRILGGANLAISADKYDLLTSLRYLTNTEIPFWKNPLVIITVFLVAVIALLYWFSAQKWDPPCVPPAPIRTWLAPKGSTLISPRCWV